MKTLSSLLAISLASALTACSIENTSYHLPEQAILKHPATQAPFLSAQGPSLAIQPVPGEWWKLYHDAKLNHLVEQAFIANTDLRIAIANLHRAQAIEASIDAGREPHATADLSANRAQASAESFLRQDKLPVSNVGAIGFTVGYEIDLFGKIKSAQEAARANREASNAATDLVRVTVAAKTVRAYTQQCSATRQIKMAQHALILQTQKVVAIERLIAAGYLSKTALAPAEMQRDMLQTQLPRIQAEQTAARYQLASLLGKTARELSENDVLCTVEPKLTQVLPIGDGAALLKRRPDIREAERQLAAATANIHVATAELYPSITIGVATGFSGLISHLGEDRTEHWSLGPLISWTIPDSGARFRIQAAKAETEAALAKFDGTVLNALRETETALTFYTHDLARNAALRSARDNAQQAVQDQRRLYTSGHIPYLSSLDADQVLVSSDQALATSDAQLAQDQVNLFLALGGGWEHAQ